MKCSRCGRENPSNATHCVYCKVPFKSKVVVKNVPEKTEKKEYNKGIIAAIIVLCVVLAVIFGAIIYNELAPSKKSGFSSGGSGGGGGSMPSMIDTPPVESPENAPEQQPEEKPEEGKTEQQPEEKPEEGKTEQQPEEPLPENQEQNPPEGDEEDENTTSNTTDWKAELTEGVWMTTYWSEANGVICEQYYIFNDDGTMAQVSIDNSEDGNNQKVTRQDVMQIHNLYQYTIDGDTLKLEDPGIWYMTLKWGTKTDKADWYEKTKNDLPDNSAFFYSVEYDNQFVNEELEHFYLKRP